ncbi:MAG: DUF481 domain-containing protein [Myxococcota bacterium]
MRRCRRGLADDRLGAIDRSARLLLLSILLLAGVATAEEGAWAPPAPPPDQWDWVRIDSGEWLKGELIVLQRDVVTFNSDEFSDLTIDWEDVLDLRLARHRIFRGPHNQTHLGTAELHGGVLRIEAEDGSVFEMPQSEVVSITYPNDFELRRWSVRLGANLAARSGNTDQQDLGANALIRRDTTYTRWESRYVGAIGKVNGTNTTNNHRATTMFDLLVTNRFFVRIPTFEFYSDEFQNIDRRYTAGAGVGYIPIDNSLAELRLAIGAAGQYTENSGDTRSTDAAAIASADLAFDLPRDIDLTLRYALQLLVTDLGRTAHSTSGVLSFSVWDPIDLDVGAYWDRIEKPERDGTGTRPKSDDFRLTVGLGVEF